MMSISTLSRFGVCSVSFRSSKGINRMCIQLRGLSYVEKFEERLYRKISLKQQEELAIVKKFGGIARSLDASPIFDQNKSDFCDWLKSKEDSSNIGQQDVQTFLEEAENWLSARGLREQGCFSQMRADVENKSPQTWGEGATEEQTQLAIRHALCSSYLGILKNEIDFLPETLTVLDYSEALKQCMTGSTDDRLKVQFRLYDKEGKGMLDEDAASQALNSLFASTQETVEKLYPTIACLTKKQKKAIPKIIKVYLLDKLQVPTKMRCVFAWADKIIVKGNVETSTPDKAFITYDEYIKNCKEFFPEYEKMAKSIMDDIERERNQAYEKQKNKRMTMLQSAIFLISIGLADSFVQSL